MSTLLLENPLLVGFLGAVLTMLAGFAWLQTGRRSILQATVGMLALTIVLVLINVNITSERERIEAILYTVADALGKNDLPAIYSAIHPTAAETVKQAKAELPKYKFSEARVTGIKDIQVNFTTKPATAIAEFNVFVAVTFQGNKFDVRRFVRVYFMQHEERWLVHDYEHFEPTAGFREPSSNAAPSFPRNHQ